MVLALRPRTYLKNYMQFRLKEIFNAETISDCKAALRKVQNGLKEIGLMEYAAFETDFTDLSCSTGDDKPLIAYIFDRLHQDPFQRTPTVEIYNPQDADVINRTYEIEHISSVSNWRDAYGDSPALDNIGNLLILTKQTNQLAGNLDLRKKISIYSERHFDNLGPVKEFADWIGKEKIKSMNPETILQRAKTLAHRAYHTVWNPWPAS